MKPKVLLKSESWITKWRTGSYIILLLSFSYNSTNKLACLLGIAGHHTCMRGRFLICVVFLCCAMFYVVTF